MIQSMMNANEPVFVGKDNLRTAQLRESLILNIVQKVSEVEATPQVTNILEHILKLNIMNRNLKKGSHGTNFVN